MEQQNSINIDNAKDQSTAVPGMNRILYQTPSTDPFQNKVCSDMVPIYSHVTQRAAIFVSYKSGFTFFSNQQASK